jgi:hypothetical protein
MQFEIFGDPDDATRLVEDDPDDTVLSGNSFVNPFKTHHRWRPCCTDGVVIGTLDGDWSMRVSFSDVDGVNGNEIEGIDSWIANSATGGNPFPLDLRVGQRVLLRPCTNSVSVAFDIKPGSCPNPINVKSKGVVSAAIMGTDSFDVTTIDPDTLKLRLKDAANGEVYPLRWALADVGAPFEPYIGKADCFNDCLDCSCSDGNMDLVFHFDKEEVVAMLGGVSDGDCLIVEIIGNLLEEYNGGEFVGEDVIRIIKKGK